MDSVDAEWEEGRGPSYQFEADFLGGYETQGQKGAAGLREAQMDGKGPAELERLADFVAAVRRMLRL